MADPKVWSTSARAWVDANENTPVGTVGSDGSTWTGTEWARSNTPVAQAALRTGAPQPPAQANRPASYTPPNTDQVIARRLSGVIFAVLGVLCAVGALSARTVFGTDVGDVVLLGLLAVAIGFGIVALVKSS